MCGIQAIFSKGCTKCLKKILEASESLKPRGPDCGTTIMNSAGVYTFKRLAIVDPSAHGNQPFTDGKIIVLCNGEIYNHKELEEKYSVKCDSQSDCEIILHLYKKVGFVEMVKQLDGVFAIALVDGDDCWYARDRIGVRPLFVGYVEYKWIAVASIANALLPFCRDVKQVPPGVAFHHVKGTVTVQTARFAELPDELSDMLYDLECVWPSFLNTLNIECKYEKMKPFEYAMNQVRVFLTKAVRKRLMSDRPIGCLLSGGLDSSIIAALLVQLLGKDKVRTYSIGMEGSVDLKYASQVAEFLGTVHTSVKFTVKDGIATIPKVIQALESYDITTIRASVPMYLLAEYISNNTDDIVIFSGEGSDELFCGYLYWHNSPSVEASAKESRDRVNKLHNYDVLRADRVVSCHGLELRVPFLDMDVVDIAFEMPAVHKVPTKGWEKYLLRKAFEDILPKSVAWRRKEAFSDGVSGMEKSWYEHIQDFVDTRIGDELFNEKLYRSKEDMYYKLLFVNLFPNYDLNVPTWMPLWSSTNDPSARTLTTNLTDTEH